MKYDKDFQFVLRGSLTRMRVHLCGQYGKEIGHCLSFPFIIKLEKIQIHNSWSYRIRWCVNACNKSGKLAVMYMCDSLCGLSIGVWGCSALWYLLAVFFPLSFLLNDGEHFHATNAVTWKWHAICIAHNHNYL
jgi:hypothetical protein